MMTSEPLVSVVTPVYNGEKYLAECIESVLAQGYQNWEYIVHDNCSTDRTVEIAQGCADRDPRIRVETNTEFLDHLKNWNRSLRSISDESAYCKIVHADDWIFPECLARMVELAERAPTVDLVASYRLDGRTVNLDGLPYTGNVYAGRELCRAALLGGPHLFGSPSSLLIRSSAIRRRDPFYNEANIHADTEACFEVLRDSDFGFVHQVLTYTRTHDEAVTAFTNRIGSSIPSGVSVFVKYGPHCLTPEEYERKLMVRLIGYSAFLAKNASRLRDPEFRRKHKETMASLREWVSLDEVMRGFRSNVARSLAKRRAAGQGVPPDGWQDALRRSELGRV